MNGEGEPSGAFQFYRETPSIFVCTYLKLTYLQIPVSHATAALLALHVGCSRFLALHIKAAVMGHPLELYSGTPVPPQLPN